LWRDLIGFRTAARPANELGAERQKQPGYRDSEEAGLCT
jgi:hypothetical protein